MCLLYRGLNARIAKIDRLGGVVLLLLLMSCGGSDNQREPSLASVGIPCGVPNTRTSVDQGGPDPLLGYQWYLDRLGVKDVWNAGINGTGIQIALLDRGLEIGHEDLRANIAANKSLNFNPGASERYDPTNCADAHGTAAAGIIAATGDNGLGIKGIAYGANIFGVNYVAYARGSNLRAGLLRDVERTGVSSNSWGFRPATRLRGRLSVLTQRAFAFGLTHGFNGKGLSYVFSAGNNRNFADAGDEDLATYDELHNYPGVIVVCAVGVDNLFAAYSNPGANLWVCGLANAGRQLGRDLNALGLPTTDLSGAEAGYNARLGMAGDARCRHRREGARYPAYCFDFGRPYDYRDTSLGVPPAAGNANYHRFFTGTSAAAPTVSGVVALMRSANHNLTWRAIKLILAESAEQLDPNAQSDGEPLGWQRAGRTYRNGSTHYTHHHDYGFGLVNASAAVALSQNWPPVPPMHTTALLSATDQPGTPDRLSYHFMVNQSNNMNITFVEYVQVLVQSNYPDFGLLDIRLISPHGTQSRLAKRHMCMRVNGEDVRPTTDCPDLAEEFTFGTATHLGENPTGTWQLQIAGPDLGRADYALGLILYGHTRQ